MVFTLVAAVGCSAPADDESSGEAGAGFPATIETAFGAVTVPSTPKRVVTIGWGSQDAALALGVVPVGMQDMTENNTEGDGVLPWDKPLLDGQSPKLVNYRTNNAPIAEIAALNPDLILAVNSGLNKDEYEKLSALAPTVAYPGKPWLTSWEDQIRMVGQALGKSEEATKLEQQTKDLIAHSRDEHPEFREKTAMFGSATTTQNYNIYLTSDSRMQLLHELGFKFAPNNPTEAPNFAAQISMENLTEIQSDVLVAWYLTPELQKQVEGSGLFRRVPAVAKHGYVPLSDKTLAYATSAVTVLSLPWMLDRYLPMLSKAAKGNADF